MASRLAPMSRRLGASRSAVTKPALSKARYRGQAARVRTFVDWVNSLSPEEQENIAAQLVDGLLALQFRKGADKVLRERSMRSLAALKGYERRNRRAGRASGTARARGNQYLREIANLRQLGRQEREVTGVIALRHGITADAVRKAIRLAKKARGNAV